MMKNLYYNVNVVDILYLFCVFSGVLALDILNITETSYSWRNFNNGSVSFCLFAQEEYELCELFLPQKSPILDSVYPINMNKNNKFSLTFLQSYNKKAFLLLENIENNQFSGAFFFPVTNSILRTPTFISFWGFDPFKVRIEIDALNEHYGEDYILPQTETHHALRSLQATEVFEHCYTGQEYGQELRIGVAVDKRLVYKSSLERMYREVEDFVAKTNIIFVTQLNIELVVADIFTEYRADDFDFTCNSSISNELTKFAQFTKPSFQGLWMLITDCLEYDFEEEKTTTGSDASGVAHVGGLCIDRRNTALSHFRSTRTWLTFAHEVGHLFGAHHSFENGVGTTGGIMDYGSGLYQNRYQFNPNRKEEVCEEIQRVGKDFECSSFSLYICEDEEDTGVYTDDGDETLQPCTDLENMCYNTYIQKVCPLTCGLCLPNNGDFDPTQPTPFPTEFPTPNPTFYPTRTPTPFPTKRPTETPTPFPSRSPTKFPSEVPTNSPTDFPTQNPTVSPTAYPTRSPTQFPTHFPTESPTLFPTRNPTNFPTDFPTDNPTPFPTKYPTKFPTTRYPTKFPTDFPTDTPTPFPTKYPTKFPTTRSPTKFPTDFPTDSPTPFPTKYPTQFPTTRSPTKFPTEFPTDIPTSYPTEFPTKFPTEFPTDNPTKFPTNFPTENPTSFPTSYPTNFPTNYPSV
eukprot:snap_masked-scaffold_34-processed-gene-3.44-mRNA-1 protein AED:0.42 eAED:0.42 QI:0/0/0/0.33/1/1/3/0/684